MAEENSKITSLMFLKEQVLRWAAGKIHQHTCEDISDLSNNYAPIKHADSSNKYGEGTSEQYGHVKVDSTINDNSTNPVQNKVIKGYVDTIKITLMTSIDNIINKKIKFITSSDTIANNQIDKDGDKYGIPTAKAVWEAIKNYDNLFYGVSLAKPINIDENINNLINPGYYLQTGTRYFSYGGEAIYYTNALIKIEKQSNRIVQHVYATSKITTNETTTYKINGAEYTRWGTGTEDWKPWHVIHKPYTKTTRVCNLGNGVDEGAITLYENTAGFIIHWDQYAQEQDKYPISAKLYEYTTVCEFSPALPITGPYVIANLIGRFDVKITSNKMQIRSTVNPGGRIIEMHETWFVPRNQ